jgi:hypothetical protein
MGAHRISEARPADISRSNRGNGWVVIFCRLRQIPLHTRLNQVCDHFSFVKLPHIFTHKPVPISHEYFRLWNFNLKSEITPLFFLFFFVPSSDLIIDGGGSQEIAGYKVSTPNFSSAFVLAIFM